MNQATADKFRMGYFIAYKNTGGIFGNGIVAKQIAAGFSTEDAQFTHIEVSGGENHSVNISPPISKLIDITKQHKGRYVRLVRYKGYNDDGKRYKVAYFSASLCNKGYDIPGILSFLFKWIKHNNRLYFCSEGVLWALQMCFPGILGIKPEECMPARFLGAEFEIVWEGAIE